MLGVEHMAAMALTAAFPFVIAAVIYRHFGGWASKAQLLGGGLLSLLMIVVTIKLNDLVGDAFRPPQDELARTAFWDAMFHAALPEEAARLVGLLVLHYLLLTRDPREFLVGACALGLGFGVIENVGYLISADNALAVGAVRGVLTAPIHMGLAILTAAGLWRWRDAGGTILDMLACLGAAMLLHGAYNTVAGLWGMAVDPKSPFEADVGLAFLLAFLCVALIVAVTMAALAAIELFRAWSADAPSHDFLHQHGLAHGRAIPFLAHTPRLVRIAAGLLAAAGVVCALWPSESMVFHAPVLIGAGASLALWARAIRRWEAAL
jgi:hypothetical protein